MTLYQSCYWRFKGEKSYRYGYPSLVEGCCELIRMGLWNGDYSHGPLVDPSEIEIK